MYYPYIHNYLEQKLLKTYEPSKHPKPFIKDGHQKHLILRNNFDFIKNIFYEFYQILFLTILMLNLSS